MRIKVGKATSKYFRTLIFLLFFFLNEAVPNAAFAFSSLNACAKSRECLALLKESAGTAVSAPTGAGYGVTTLRTTTSTGAIKTFVNGVADFAIVVGPSAAYVSWHYWNEAHNGQAQERAKQRYCAAYPTDVVCRPFTGGQCYDIYYDVYGFVFFPNYPLSNTEQKLGSALLGQINGIVSGIDYNGISTLYRLKYTRGNGSVVYKDMLSSAEPNSGVVISRVILVYGNPDVCGNPPPLPLLLKASIRIASSFILHSSRSFVFVFNSI